MQTWEVIILGLDFSVMQLCWGYASSVSNHLATHLVSKPKSSLSHQTRLEENRSLGLSLVPYLGQVQVCPCLPRKSQYKIPGTIRRTIDSPKYTKEGIIKFLQVSRVVQGHFPRGVHTFS